MISECFSRMESMDEGMQCLEGDVGAVASQEERFHPLFFAFTGVL